jgi:hypothetical protein
MCNSFLDCCDRAQRWDLALHILTRRFDIDDQRARWWDVARHALVKNGDVIRI